MKKAYFVEIKPTTEQAIKINKTIGVCRYVYNFYRPASEKAHSFRGGMKASRFLHIE
ncbi:transposase, IS605 family [Geobacillus proteiniphilus]|uniref:Transposase, IS605 family n=1 Tax=Geobacillus proteiniphilus TaxID=860353 RepID=A0A1Q5SHW6_9BACL|nr:MULTISPECIES: helix-turn-helix domain-containing protein [Geobacillus]OKO87592.1 transposase, IS605 family [Geobacillus proteiniphilus]OPX02391.1 hypothetical protein B1A75_12825 [Geobacillus sp. LEMMY01]